MEYIPVKIIRAELKKHYDKHGTCTTIPAVCRHLQRKISDSITTEYHNPFPQNISDLSDEEFMNYFVESLYPLSKTLDAISRDDAFSYMAETIFSKQYLFMVFLHENYALQTMHAHDYFEITYVFRGNCKMTFENDSVSMSAGNICIIPPGTLHEPYVLDDDSFVMNLSMTREAFEAAFAPVFLRKDLISYYVQTILYNENEPNYLYIPSSSSLIMKKAVKQLTYEQRCNGYDSFSTCTSWLSVFISDLFHNYRSEVRVYQNKERSDQTDHLALLEYIQEHFRDITLESMARYFHYNTSYLSRLILKIAGRSFVEIIADLRLKIGRELLENTELTLDQIAEFIGYRSGDYFSKVFKKTSGISAAAYRHSFENAGKALT